MQYYPAGNTAGSVLIWKHFSVAEVKQRISETMAQNPMLTSGLCLSHDVSFPNSSRSCQSRKQTSLASNTTECIKDNESQVSYRRKRQTIIWQPATCLYRDTHAQCTRMVTWSVFSGVLLRKDIYDMELKHSSGRQSRTPLSNKAYWPGDEA